jgi:osmoprotectant transport system ATP-binding protein
VPVDNAVSYGVLELRGVSKRYGSRTALQPLDLTVPAGRTLAVIGPSGCGKSTLLRLMNGLVLPDQGRVVIDGVALAPGTLRAVRHRIGCVLQDGGLFPHLTARANVTLLARHLGRRGDWIDTRLHALAALTRFPGDGLDRYPAQLSGGQRQRVSLMRALMLDPDVLLLDEPLGALDPIVRSDLQADLKAVFGAVGKTVVLVTHDLAEAGYLGDALLLLDHGRVVQHGTLEDLVRRPASPFVTLFLNAQRGPVAPSGTPPGGAS